MNLRRLLVAAATLAAIYIPLGSPAAASGLWPGFPAATSITGTESLPADTGATNGSNPATELITPTQLRGSFNGTNSLRNINTGGAPAANSTDGNDTTPAATEVYIAEMTVDVPGTATGLCVFNGSVASGNIKVGLGSSSGAVLATSISTAMSGTDSYQCVAFATPYVMVPGVYYALEMVDNATARVNTYGVGKFGASKQTGQVYATGFTAFTAPTTFTANVGPVAGLY